MIGSVLLTRAGSRAEREPHLEVARVGAGALAASSEPPLLRVSGLRVSFGQVRALDGVDLSVRTGELVALAGENGAGKTTLVRCIAGDIVPAAGEVFLAGRRVPADPGGAAKHGIAVVWQDLALCDNLDIAANIMLGRESARLMLSETRFHRSAAALLASLQIPLTDTTRIVKSLSGAQRQLVAVARAMSRQPLLLALDEPTASLGVKESAQVEELILNLREQGTTILLVCHDIDQMFRLADRIVVLRQGQILADLRPADTYPDDVVALLSGQEVDSSARRQLTRLHGLTDRLVSADPSSSLPLILSALGAALGSERLCIHVVSDKTLHCAASLGFPQGQLEAWSRLPFGAAGGPVGLAAADEQPVIADNVRVGAAWRSFRDLAKTAKVASSWSVPLLGPGGLSGVITVFRPVHGAPMREEIDLVTVYAGYAASAIERDRLLDQFTTRNRVLETIREMLETLAGPVPVSEGLAIAIQSLRRGLQAEEVALITLPADQPARWRAYAGPFGTDPSVRDPVPGRPGGQRAGQRRPGRGGQGAAQQPQAPRAGGRLRGGGRPHRPAGHLAARAADQGGGGADGGRGVLAPACAGTRGSRSRPPGGGGAAPLARAPARLPLPFEPRAADPADGHPRVRVQPDAARRDLGRRFATALPRPDRRGVGPPRPTGR